MRFWSKAAFAALLAIGLSTVAHAQAPINPLLPTEGTREVELRGNIVFEPDDSFDLHLSYGPFLNPNLQVGGSVDYVDAGPSEVWSLGGFANWHFPGPSELLPYVGAFLGYTDGDNVDGDFTWGLQGGVKYFLNPSVAATGALVYRNLEDSDDDWRIQFGLAVYLR